MCVLNPNNNDDYSRWDLIQKDPLWALKERIPRFTTNRVKLLAHWIGAVEQHPFDKHHANQNNIEALEASIDQLFDKDIANGKENDGQHREYLPSPFG